LERIRISEKPPVVIFFVARRSYLVFFDADFADFAELSFSAQSAQSASKNLPLLFLRNLRQKFLCPGFFLRHLRNLRQNNFRA